MHGLRPITTAICVALVACLLAGCVVEEPAGRPHGNWCYWHPGACR
jgi:hypothetical protein